MTDEAEQEVPDGAAVFPLIPPDLNVHPLLLGVLHAVVFLAGSEEQVVNPEAAGETIDLIAGYVRRLTSPDLDRFRADLRRLAEYARQENWSKLEVEFLETFLTDCGLEGEGEA